MSKRISRRASRWRGRPGFTLVELLVVIAIIGILVGLMIPAVNMAREAARRTSCHNNLRQIGLALNMYHESHKTFPPGGIGFTRRATTHTLYAWSALILPFVEQDVLYDKIDFTKPYDAALNEEAAAVVLPVYVCPSAPQGDKLKSGRGPTQYGGMHGERISSPNNPPKGVMLYDDTVKMHQIPDGLSMTMIVGEDSEFADGQWIYGRNVFDQAFAINAAPPMENDLRSQHPGGANAVFCDATVRFLPETTDLEVLAALCTRAGSELVEPPWD